MKLFDFFKKKEIQEEVKPKKRHIVFTAPEISSEKLEKLYKCSVQKTPKDFLIQKFDIGGNLVNVAMDEADTDGAANLQALMNDTYQMKLAGQEIIFTYYAKQGFIGFNNCAVLAQDWLIQKAIAAPCKDAVAIDYKLTCNDEEITSEEQDLMAKMKNASDDKIKFNIKEVCRIFAENNRKYGQAVCIPVVEGIDYSIPFNIDAVAPNSYKGMAVVEPVWLAPVLDIDGTINPLSSRFYKPVWFRLPNGSMIHYTWVIWGVYGTVSDILKPTYYWGGIPLPQLLYEQVYAAHKTAKEAPMLAQSKRLNYMEMLPETMLFDKEASLKVKLMSWMRNNFGFLLIRPEQKIGQIDTTLADFDAVVMLGYQITAAISGVISSRLLETSPKGWQSSGSYEDNQYSKLLQTIQEDDFKPLLDFHYRLLAKSKYGIDRRYVITFNEIDTPGAKEAAEIREINSRTDTNYINAGVLAAEEVRTELRTDADARYNALEEDMLQTEPDMFSEEELKEDDGSGHRFFTKERLREGNGKTQQNPFEQDEYFNLDEWKEEEHPRNKDGEFANGGSGSITKNETFEKDVEKILEDAKKKKDNRAKVEIGGVSQKLTDEAKKNGFNISGYKHNVDVSGIQHTFREHGGESERKRGQIPITDNDIKKIPEILYNYDKVTFGTKDKKGTDIIKYQKQMPDGEVFYLEEIRTGQKTLTIKTMYKKSR